MAGKAKDPRLAELAGAGASVNEKILRETIMRAIYTQHLTNANVRELMGFMNGELLPDLIAELTKRLDRIAGRGFDSGPVTTQRFKDLVVGVRDVLGAGINDEAKSIIQTQLGDLAGSEAAWQAGLIEKQTKAFSIDVVQPSGALMRELVKDGAPIGKTVKEMLDGISRNATTDVVSQIRIGIASGEGTEEMVRRVKGTIDAHYEDGTFEKVRRQVEGTVRTANNYVANRAREAVFEENTDVVGKIMISATLDARTCFPAGTLVVTARGHVPIECVQPGEFVLTHLGRFRRVVATRSKPYTGLFSEIESEGRRLLATDKHPLLTDRGWREIGSLRVGDRVMSVDQRADSIDMRGAEISAELLGTSTDEREACGCDRGVFAAIAIRRMPVGSVDFERDVAVDKEVDRVAPERLFCNESNADGAQCLGDVALRDRRGFAASIAGHGTETARVDCAWDDSESDLARVTSDDHRRASAFLGAIPDVVAPRGESQAAAETIAVDDVAGLARDRAHRVSVYVASWDRERLAARSANLGRSQRAASFDEASARTVRPGARSVLDERRSAVKALTFHGARLSFVRSFYSQETVFDLQVEGDESFVAEGFAVHNCPICRAFDGRTYPVGEGLRPPYHPGGCRCQVVPVTKSWKELGLDDDFQEGDQSLKLRESMDGHVPASTTYDDWLRQVEEKDPARVTHILGPERARMWRAGEVGSVRDFVNDKGRILTLDQLDKLHDR